MAAVSALLVRQTVLKLHGTTSRSVSLSEVGSSRCQKRRHRNLSDMELLLLNVLGLCPTVHTPTTSLYKNAISLLVLVVFGRLPADTTFDELIAMYNDADVQVARQHGARSKLGRSITYLGTTSTATRRTFYGQTKSAKNLQHFTLTWLTCSCTVSDATKLERVFNSLKFSGSACFLQAMRLFSPDICAADVTPTPAELALVMRVCAVAA